jgi:hypothetical protein
MLLKIKNRVACKQNSKEEISITWKRICAGVKRVIQAPILEPPGKTGKF